MLGAPQERLVALLKQGYSLHAACKEADISYYTFREWMQKGGDPASRGTVCPAHIQVEPYYSFARAIRAAEQEGRSVERPRCVVGPAPKPLTALQRERLLFGFQQGWTLRAIARHADVRLSTLLSWLHRGGYPKRLSFHIPLDPSVITEPYKSFVADVLQAEDRFFGGDW